ncbi:lysylphosphatidylglycerol synthase domain-containing protein [Variovorax sp. J22P240]|uniref:lysylphosphatidylglycerol synthase domain-containing protein n=1 Tax=Variovorax sp. J22P240 TaxID=3053514 RepID=UPI002578A3EF|nr:lysylphosphatidylglycerol synthase domain-containing protein [Variovorax sp. J22P240]MDL9999216.1 lysylphosphatidylglycerol synthase domain-containing protein [Variovorax sp. J22P240]
MAGSRGSAMGAVEPPSRPANAWWQWLKRIAAWLFFAIVIFLIVRQARTIDWSDVLDSVRAIPLPMLLAALLLAIGSHALYSTYDLLGRRMTGHKLATGTVMGVTFISYAFNLNLGSLVGGVAFRYRLYSRLGLDNNTITRVLGFSMLTNWFGYFVVAGAAFCFWPMGLPPDWKIDGGGLRLLGAALLLVGVAYLALCAIAREHTWRIRNQELDTPPLRIALLQLAMSCGNWCLIGGVIWFLLQQQLAYPTVLAVFLVAAVAGVITHVPGGLGVLEAVFIALLSHRVPQEKLLGALLAYRAIYYLLPLIVASLFYVVTELRAKRLRKTAPAPQA